MFIILRPETANEKARGFRCGFIVTGTPGKELRRVTEGIIPAYEVEGDERNMSLIAFQHSHKYKSI